MIIKQVIDVDSNELARHEMKIDVLFDVATVYQERNAQSLITNLVNEVDGYNKESVLRKAEGIYDTLLTIFSLSEAQNILTIQASNALAEQRIASVAHVHRTFNGQTIINR